MRIFLPNSAFIGNVETFIQHFNPEDPSRLDFSYHDKWVYVHPAILSLTACLADRVKNNGGEIHVNMVKMRSLPYLIRMKLFDFLGTCPAIDITEHDPTGRFVPLTQIKTGEDLQSFITSMIPLLHANPEEATPIKYTISELVRNVLEHSNSQSGAFVCAQYFKKTNRVSIGIADSGVGIKKSISFSHPVATDEEAIRLALTPGITGTTQKIGGTESNAGAGLFFIKSIAKTSRNFFMIYSGSSVFKLRKTPKGKEVVLHADPANDNMTFWKGVPCYPGTMVGIDITAVRNDTFQKLLSNVHKVYRLDVKRQKKQKYKRATFI